MPFWHTGSARVARVVPPSSNATAARGNCSQYPTPGIQQGRLVFPNDQLPDASPVYGCNLRSCSGMDCCLRISNGYSVNGAYDSHYFSNIGYSVMSYPLSSTDVWRMPYVAYQLQLDREYR